jgi:N-acetylmuramoyl-L-alanine amidase
MLRRCWPFPVAALLVLALTAAGAAADEVGGDADPDRVPLGVVMLDGIAFPVVEEHPVAPIVTTPCTNQIRLMAGTRLDTVDIVIDPGHGGPETGSVGANRLYERDLNLEVALLTEQELTELGYSVTLTRRTDLHMPIRQRSAIARALAPQVFISIHHNGGAVRPSDDPGTETFHQVNNPDSRRLAGILYEEIQETFSAYDVEWVDTVHQGASSRLKAAGEDAYGVLRLAPEVTSVITEALYMSHSPEARLMADPEVKAAEAAALARGIDRYLTTDDPGSGFRRSFVDPAMTGTGTGVGCVDPDYASWAEVSSGYTEAEHEALIAAADRLGRSPDWMQRFGVRTLDFFSRLDRRASDVSSPSLRTPDVSGTMVVTSSWTEREREVLRRVADLYGVTEAEAQKLGAELMVVLAGRLG